MGDVEDGNPRLRRALRRALVRVSVKDRGDLEARQWILEAAGSEPGKNLRWLALDGSADRSIVHEHDSHVGLESGESETRA